MRSVIYTVRIIINPGFGMSITDHKPRKIVPPISKQKMEMIYVVVFTVTCSILSFSFELEFVETMYQFTRSHENWELDEFIFSFFWLALSLIVYSLRRVSELKTLSKENAHNAKFDHLTQLPNRKHALAHLQSLLRHAKKNKLSVAVVFIDLNNFKQINDFHGHHYGDLFLKAVSRRLSSSLHAEELVSRIGGDEFLFISEFNQQHTSASAIIERITSNQHTSYVIEGKTVSTGFSSGVAIYPQDGLSVEALIVASDTAMYHAKQTKTFATCYYNEELGRINNERILLEKHLKNALTNDELYLVFQPIVDVVCGNIIGFEALTRWRLNGTYINPEVIVTTADNAGLAEAFYTWLFTATANNSKQFLTANQFISLNISAVQFLNEHFLSHVTTMFSQHSLSHIEFEITENSIFIDYEKASSAISTLRQLGINVMIDDFGKDYSSLSRLRMLDVDKIKIDKSFLHDATNDAKSLGIFESVIALAKKLELKIVIEGIETNQQLQLVQQHAPLFGQGYLFQVPATPEQLKHESQIIDLVSAQWKQTIM
jgi:diguanylate cyclase (GGDEF)-like protein